MAFDSLKPDQSLLIPLADIKALYKDPASCAQSLRTAIRKRSRIMDPKVVVRAFEEGIRIWKLQ